MMAEPDPFPAALAMILCERQRASTHSFGTRMDVINSCGADEIVDKLSADEQYRSMLRPL
jgi:hypothetical protein